MSDEIFEQQQAGEPTDPEEGREGSLDLGSGLVVTLAFELHRIAVPLRDLESWSEGTTVALERQPDDAVKILLQQGSGTRVIGYGRVVMVKDQLGVQIERWLARAET